MKLLLYFGATLMVGAGIYGFIDLKKKDHNKEFQSLYREEQKKETPKLAPDPAVPDPVITEKKDVVIIDEKSNAGKKQVAKKKDKAFTPKQFSRAALKEEVVLEEIEEDTLSAPEIKVEQKDH